MVWRKKDSEWRKEKRYEARLTKNARWYYRNYPKATRR